MKNFKLSKLKIDRGNTSTQNKNSFPKILGLLLLASGLMVFLWLNVAKNQFGTRVVEVITTGLVYPSQEYTVLNSSGYVVPQRKAAISSKAQGRIIWLGVLEGSIVKKGQVIARLEKKDVQASLEQALAQEAVAEANLKEGYAELKQAKLIVKRSRNLLAEKFISEAKYDENLGRLEKAEAGIASLKARIMSAKANTRVAKIAVEQTIIKSPFDGVVLTKSANVGDNITPFSSAADSKGAVVTIADMSTLEVEADVSEASISKLKIGTPCEITLDAIPEKRLFGQISRMVPTVDRSKATVLVKVSFVDSHPGILPDMSAKVAFLSKKMEEEEKLPVSVLPSSAIMKNGSESYIYRVIDNRLYRTPVELGISIGGKTEVKGLVKNVSVVANPNDRLKDRMQVTVK